MRDFVYIYLVVEQKSFGHVTRLQLGQQCDESGLAKKKEQYL